MAESRADKGLFAAGDIDHLFDAIGLPRPAKTSNILAALQRDGLATRVKGSHRASWKLTPEGRGRAQDLMSDMDVIALIAEAEAGAHTTLGKTTHPVIPPELAPPELIQPLRAFLDRHPFDNNVFGMTRFPDEPDEHDDEDPVRPALEVARSVCEQHGLDFHLASDRQIVDDLWQNVTAHMWASRYGIAFFEDRRGRGLNYNLTIEVGGMLLSGRRTALLKDASIAALPTDLVGRIYKPIDLDDVSSVESALEKWIRDDLER